MKAGHPTWLSLVQDGAVKTTWKLTGEPEALDIKKYAVAIEVTYPLYSNLKIEVPFEIIVYCVVTSIKPEFT